MAADSSACAACGLQQDVQGMKMATPPPTHSPLGGLCSGWRLDAMEGRGPVVRFLPDL